MATRLPRIARPKRGILPRLLFIAALFFAPHASAEDAERVEFKFGGYLKMQEEGDEVLWLCSPSVKIVRGSMTILCDSLVVWSKKGEGGPADPAFKLEEFYAEGNLRMESGPPPQIMEGDRAYVNLRTGSVLLIKGKLLAVSKKRGLPIVLSAEEFRKVGTEDMTALNATFSTCTFGVPDYRLNVKEVVIHENWKKGDIDLHHLTVEIDPIVFPLFYLPYLPVSFGSQIPLRKLRYEKSSRFGHSVYSKFGIDIPLTRRDASGEPLRDEDGDPIVDTWGSIFLDADWLELRGFGFGPEYDYEWDDYKGFGDVYYINDSGRSPDSDFQDRFIPIPKEDRGRARLFHRHKLWQGLQLDLELHRVSDRNFREEFLEKEFKNDKEPETYGLLRFIDDNFGMTGLYRMRINDFQNQVEYLPQVTQSLLSQPLLLGAHLSHNAQYANVRFRKDKDLPDADQERLNRFDVHETLTRPFALGPLRFLPFASARWTYFDYDRTEDEFVDRYAAAVGARVRAAVWKLFPLKSQVLGLDGVRHVASVEARWLRQWTSVRSAELFQFDAVDQVDRFEEVVLEVRNRFETKNPGTGEIYDALNVGVAIELYPDDERDTKRRVPQNVLYPNYYITLAPDRRGAFKERSFSNIHFDVAASVREKLAFEFQFDVNPYRGKIEETHSEVRIRPMKDLVLRLTQQYVIHLTNTVGVGFEWKLSEKWLIGGKTDYDFRGDRSIEHTYFIRRDLHDFDLELSVTVDEGRDETSASVSLIPHGKKEQRLRGP